MNYQEVFEKLKNEIGLGNIKGVKEHVAFQINILGEGEGAFYIEACEGELHVEPYDYKDNDLRVEAEASVLSEIFTGKLMLNAAVESGKVILFGNEEKANVLQEIVTKEVKKEEKKAVAAKEEPKKEEVKKEEAKKAEPKKETKAKKDTKKKSASKKKK